MNSTAVSAKSWLQAESPVRFTQRIDRGQDSGFGMTAVGSMLKYLAAARNASEAIRHEEELTARGMMLSVRLARGSRHGQHRLQNIAGCVGQLNRPSSVFSRQVMRTCVQLCHSSFDVGYA